MLAYAYSQHIGLSALVSTGNEAIMSLSDVANYFVDDEATQVIALFVESFRNPVGFREVARRALARGKPIVAFKIGRSEVSAKVAQAHTGSLVGDDRVIDALFRQSGVIRVDSLEDLLITAGTLAQTGVLPGRRLGFQSISGGACDMAADRAEQEGIVFPPFAQPTKQALAELLPVLGSANNPLDTTGAAITNDALYGQVLTVISKDPGLDIFLCGRGLPTRESDIESFAHTAEVLRDAPCPAYLITNTCDTLSESAHRAIEQSHLPYLPGGIYHGFAALGKAMWWSERYREALESAEESESAAPTSAFHEAFSGAWSEHQARALLQQHGIPVVPASLATTVEEACEAARSFGFPVALKIVSPDILHKSDIGGVRLGVRDENEVREASQQIQEAARKLTPQPALEGILVSPMRQGGVELLIGIARDPVWGQVLAVGLGGIWVEVLKDTVLCVLPVSHAEIRAMLDELQGGALLRGARGTKPADIDALVEVIFAISQLAQSLGTNLEALEINPLRVDGTQIEALDALLTWQSPS
jgi:acyl-CoA synthetase (NDP forming)